MNSYNVTFTSGDELYCVLAYSAAEAGKAAQGQMLRTYGERLRVEYVTPASSQMVH